MKVSLEEMKKLNLSTASLEYFENMAFNNYVDLLKVWDSNIFYLFYYLDKVPNSLDIMKELIELGANINAKDKKGNTPLYYNK